MIFNQFKTFERKFGQALESVTQYLGQDLAASFRELHTGLRRLTFQENFESFQVTLTIEAATENQIPNGFRNGKIPTQWIVVSRDAFSHLVCNGDTVWTTQSVYLKNTSATDSTTLTVVFLR